MSEESTIIGPTITIRGGMRSEENISIQGKVEGRTETSADLLVEEGGTIEAEVETRSIDIRGAVIGNVVATDRIQIHPGGSVVGDLRAPRVIIEDGGVFKGHVDMDQGSKE